MTLADLSIWAHAHLYPLAATVLSVTHTACWLARSPLAKGAPIMNALQIIPIAIAGAEDALKLTKAFESGDKAGAVQDITDAIPLIAQLTGKAEAELRALLTPEAIGAAFDLAQAAEAIVVAVEKAVAAHAAPAPAAEPAADQPPTA